MISKFPIIFQFPTPAENIVTSICLFVNFIISTAFSGTSPLTIPTRCYAISRKERGDPLLLRRSREIQYHTNPEKSTALSDQSFACTESKSRCLGFWRASFHARCQSAIMVCMRTSSAAVSGSASAAVHSMRCFASSSKLATTVGSVDFLAEDEIRPSVAASPPKRRGADRAKSVREVCLCLSLSISQ
jgi:hypothetical protein